MMNSTMSHDLVFKTGTTLTAPRSATLHDRAIGAYFSLFVTAVAAFLCVQAVRAQCLDIVTSASMPITSAPVSR